MAEFLWKRPETAPFPCVWRRFKGLKAMPDGKVPNFWVQDVPDDRMEEIVDFMCDSFLKEETMCKTTGVLKDRESLPEIRDLWMAMLRQRAALVAFTDWPDGSPRIAGCNVTGVVKQGEPPMKLQGIPISKVLRALHFIEDKVDVFEKYGVEEYMTALGLSVAPEFRGQDVGLQLLLARTDLGRVLGLKLTVTVFTGIASQKQSARAGFEILAEVPYDEYKEGGELVFPGASCKSFSLKAKRIE